MLDRIEFLLTEAFTALRRNGLMTFAAISTAAVALFLLGGLGYVYFRASQYTSQVTGKFEMSAFMKMDLPRDKAQETAKKVAAMSGVKNVKLVPKEEAWVQQQKELGLSSEGLLNPLPDQLHITLSDLTRADEISRQIQALPEVYEPDGVEYSKDAQKLMNDMLGTVRIVGGVLGFLLLVTSGILIYNAIRLTVISRRREIRIMQLVGASYSTIWTPFVIEGTIQGALGGTIASFLLYGAQAALQGFLQKYSVGVHFEVFPLWPVMGLLAAAGAMYGFFCSSFAVREPLRHGATVQR